MNCYVRAVSSPGLAPGFRLAGLVVDEIGSEADGAEVSQRLSEAAIRPDTGILLIEQQLFDRASEAVRQTLERCNIPIVVTVPPPAFVGRKATAEDFILELLRRAIGYRVRLQ